jgi:hypothetical protein
MIIAPELSQLGRAAFPALYKWAPKSLIKNIELNHPYTLARTLLFNVAGVDVPVYYDTSSEPDGLTGASVGWLWFDEGARARTRRAYDILLGRLREGPAPQMLLTSTPRGKNWLWEAVVAGQKAGILEIFYLPTAGNAAHLDPEYISTLNVTLTGRMREQELLGRFTTLEGVVWEMLSEENVTEKAEYNPHVQVEWAVDDGFTRGHPRVILLCQEVPPHINVFDYYSAEYEYAETTIANVLAKQYPKPTTAFVDSAAAELRSRLWEQDIDTIAATHPVDDGIKHTAPFILDGSGVRHLRFHPRAYNAFQEMRMYCYDEKTGKPLKNYDHVGDCVRYLLRHKDLSSLIEDGKRNPHAT